MRIGNMEIPGGILVMLAFALVVGLLILWTWYYYARQRGELRRLADSHGWQYLGKDAPAVRTSLEGMGTKYTWRTDNIMLVEGHGNRVYLFTYDAASHTSDSSEQGGACLAERRGGFSRGTVIITPVNRLLSGLARALMEDVVEAGGPEFRQQFIVQSQPPEIAAAAVSKRVQDIALQRSSGPYWSSIFITDRFVLVTVTYPIKSEEWEKLLNLTRQLRSALN